MKLKNEQQKLPKRKHPRLGNYDYSAPGAYFVTVCTQNRKCILSRILGNGLTPDENVEYTLCGRIAKKQLELIEERYPFVKIDKYVIMPNHIHVIFIFQYEAAGASPRPTVMDVVCAFKSLTARECKKNGFDEKVFQDSFYEHIVRSREDYEEIVKYIEENPMRWYYDELYAEK